MAANYAAVLLQLQNFGLIVASLEPGRIMRCKVDGDREKRGWYVLHEVTLSGGDQVLVGSFGIWHGADNNVQKVELKKLDLSAEQKAAIKARMADDKKRADAEQRRRSDRAAAAADKVWHKLAEDGISEYLTRKGVSAFGVRFTPTGAVAVPVLDTAGRLHGLQFILDKFRHKEKIKAQGGRDKQFWPPGVAKKAHFHLIGSPATLLAIGEGYATCASYHMATGFAVAVAFDAGNLAPVAQAMKKRYPKARLLILGDDDAFGRCKHCQKPVDINAGATCPACGEAHGRKNAGAEFAELASLAVDARFILPRFSDPAARFDHYARNQGKLTDFNDLHLTDGLHTVRVQVEDAIARFGWAALVAAGAASRKGGGDSKTLKPIDTADELLERFALVYGKGGTVFDHREHLLVTLSDMRDACMSREIHRRWQESPTRSIVRAENVGFDPAGQDANVTCNLWAGWPTVPKAGQCDQLLSLLYHMCSGEQNSLDLAKWVIKWLAYPLQHPGAKMRTTLVLHGPQGTGKNLFFEAIMGIYGCYGRVIDQSAIEDKFNDWASRKLFLIADEVVARSDLYHIKNKLKAFITGEWIRINPKNMAAYEERNHVNLVFLSNERMPVVIEEDDRRHCVIWTPPKKEPGFYKAIGAEIDAGGIAALHDWLLNIVLDDFNEFSSPPMTQAKEELLHLGKDSILRFYDEWIGGELDGIPNLPVLTEDIYDLYRHWCSKQGVRPAPLNRAADALAKRPGMRKERKRFFTNGVQTRNPKAFLFPLGFQEVAPGSSESYWLGDCVRDFRLALDDYKGGFYGRKNVSDE